MRQSTKNILLIKPSGFVYNKETSASNAFQHTSKKSIESIKQKAFDEFEMFTETLRLKGANTFIFDDTMYPEKPDAIFPNNWATFHADGTVILYPMLAYNRRHERRTDIIDSLKQNFSITNILDLSYHEKNNKFLEGTGSIVFDHKNKIAYASLSPRTDKELFLWVCEYLNYSPVCFHSYDKTGKEIYHTNVMMCVAEKFAIVCAESILDHEREKVVHSLEETHHTIIKISFEQMQNFAGNMLAIAINNNKNILALSKTAFDSLTKTQKKEIEKHCELVPLSIHTIETIGGGSARCMMAEIFLQPLTIK